MGFDDGRRIRSALKVGKLKFSVSKDGGAGKRRKGLPPNVPRPRRCKLREREGQVYAAEAGKGMLSDRVAQGVPGTRHSFLHRT